MNYSGRHNAIVAIRRHRAGLPLRHVPLHREPRGRMPGLHDMLGHRRSIRGCGVIYRIPRSRGLQTMSDWPLLRWRNMRSFVLRRSLAHSSQP